MVINTREELRNEVENLNNSFQELLYEKDNLQQKEKIINLTSQNINIMNAAYE